MNNMSAIREARKARQAVRKAIVNRELRHKCKLLAKGRSLRRESDEARRLADDAKIFVNRKMKELEACIVAAANKMCGSYIKISVYSDGSEISTHTGKKIDTVREAIKRLGKQTVLSLAQDTTERDMLRQIIVEHDALRF